MPVLSAIYISVQIVVSHPRMCAVDNSEGFGPSFYMTGFLFFGGLLSCLPLPSPVFLVFSLVHFCYHL